MNNDKEPSRRLKSSAQHVFQLYGGMKLELLILWFHFEFLSVKSNIWAVEWIVKIRTLNRWQPK